MAVPFRIVEISTRTTEYLYRSPMKFGGVAVDRATVLDVRLIVETPVGQRASGCGSMPLGNVWAWPTRERSYEDTLGGMLQAVELVRRLFLSCQVPGHPIRISHELEAEYAAIAGRVNIGLPMPRLAVYVVASAFDAALHDAYGQLCGLNCYRTYGPDHFPDDLGEYLGPLLRGCTLQPFVNRQPQATMPLYHLVGALDPLSPAEVTKPCQDGLPEHLGDWITRDGLSHLKIKLNGDDLTWDVDRILAVQAIASQIAPERSFRYSLDFNERCPHEDYLLEVLQQLLQYPQVYDGIQYIEQPTARDLAALPQIPMHAAAKLKPIVIDESLLDLASLLQARELGYTGVALKACKGQSQSLLLAAAAQKLGLFRCVQDLTCPGAALIHSAGLAAHIPGVVAIEANSRQYLPAANEAWDKKYPGLFTIRNGHMRTGQLNGVGLSTAQE